MLAVARRWAVRAAAAGLALLAGCTGGPVPGGDGGPAGRPRISRAVIAAMPADGAQEVHSDAEVAVTVAGGRLLSVRLADDRGVTVPGRTAPDGTRWTPEEQLSPATPYTVDAVAQDADGLRADHHSGFVTAGPAHTVAAFVTPEDGALVGVGMPVSLRFTRPVADRAAAERAVEVVADPPVPLAAHWFGNRRLDVRPQSYWAPGTRVTVSLRLKDVELAPGEYGTQAKEVAFTVGRARISTVDLASSTLTVREDGEPVRTLKVTAGGPQHPTYRGVLVVSEKFEETRMNARTVGLGDEYDIKDVPHAMRLTDSGTFVHGNYWADEAVFGTANTSHGCIGIADRQGGDADSPAGWLFEHTLVGDVLEVRGDTGAVVQPSNGLNGWNMPWAAWLKGSALGPAAR
ncbi:Ig-like domain-containing protein [Kitasatospora sp. NPDC085879]|uniref:L,D-transpeptidase n=1 Tax=Kitasatospora sp. NPDC085879 TaxID=3154769 RepID=UPI0034297AFB